MCIYSVYIKNKILKKKKDVYFWSHCLLYNSTLIAVKVDANADSKVGDFCASYIPLTPCQNNLCLWVRITFMQRTTAGEGRHIKRWERPRYGWIFCSIYFFFIIIAVVKISIQKIVQCRWNLLIEGNVLFVVKVLVKIRNTPVCFVTDGKLNSIIRTFKYKYLNIKRECIKLVVLCVSEYTESFTAK